MRSDVTSRLSPQGSGVPSPVVERLACVACRNSLQVLGDSLSCEGCGRLFPWRGGIADFLTDAPGRRSAFTVDRLDALARAEETHFWFAGRRDLLRHALTTRVPPGASVLDVGCGTGRAVSEWVRLGYGAAGVDFLAEGLTRCADALPEVFLARADAAALPFADASWDAVTCLDLLEHVDDRVVLAEVRRVLRPGGVLLASVPSHPWLWSALDDDAGHLRRYSRRALEDRLREAGLAVAWVRPYQCLLLPVLAAVRLSGRGSRAIRDSQFSPPSCLNGLLRWVNLVEARLSRYVPLPWGSSLVVVARRTRDVVSR